MASEASPAVIDKGAGGPGTLRGLTPHLVVPEAVIAPESIGQAFYIFTLPPLLPVQPPEVNALFFKRMDNGVEVSVGPFLLVEAERYGSPPALAAHRGFVAFIGPSLLGIDIALGAVVIIGTAQIIGHKAGVAVFVGTDSGCGMKVESSLEPLAMQFCQQALRIGNKVAVPGVAGPAAPLAELVVPKALVHRLPGLVPVHIDDEHIGRDVTLAHIFGELEELLVGVDPVAAPPIPEYEPGRQGDIASHLCKVLKGS